jgi:hypothetical protein
MVWPINSELVRVAAVSSAILATASELVAAGAKMALLADALPDLLIRGCWLTLATLVAAGGIDVAHADHLINRSVEAAIADLEYDLRHQVPSDDRADPKATSRRIARHSGPGARPVGIRRLATRIKNSGEVATQVSTASSSPTNTRGDNRLGHRHH